MKIKWKIPVPLTCAGGAQTVGSVLYLECPWVEAAYCSRCCNPCVSPLCVLLYTGSSVLQTEESPGCSLDKVPQALACDWLLACLQVTSPFRELDQSTTSLMLLILLIKQKRAVFFSLRNVILYAVISNYVWLMALQLLFDLLFFLCFVIKQFT